MLIETHRGLGDDDSRLLNARPCCCCQPTTSAIWRCCARRCRARTRRHRVADVIAALDATHDPHGAAGSKPPTTRPATSRSRTCPSAASGPPAAQPWRIGVAIGDQVLDLRPAASRVVGPRPSAWLEPFAEGELAPFMALGGRRDERRGLRAVRHGAGRGAASRKGAQARLVPQAAVEYALPCRIGDYTDFYTGIHHATAVGQQAVPPRQPAAAQLPWVPITTAASSIDRRGTPCAARSAS